MRALLAALLALGAAAPAAAQPATSSAAATTASAEAVALADMLSPPEALTDIGMKAAQAGFMATAEHDPEVKSLEAEYPGIVAYAWNEIAPEFRRYTMDLQPLYRQRLAALFGARLTAAEITTLHGFYASPTGQKMIRIMYSNLDFAPMVETVAASPDALLTAKDMAALQAKGQAKAVASMTADDEAVLLKLVQKISVGKMKSVGEAVQKLSLDMANEPAPELEERVGRLATAAMEGYIAEQDAKR